MKDEKDADSRHFILHLSAFILSLCPLGDEAAARG